MIDDTKYSTFMLIEYNFCNVHDFLQKYYSEYFQDIMTAIIDSILLDLVRNTKALDQMQL